MLLQLFVSTVAKRLCATLIVEILAGAIHEGSIQLLKRKSSKQNEAMQT